MYFKRLISLLLVSHLVSAEQTPVTETGLTAIPDTCVALREGRSCYADVTINWQQPLSGNYCLRDADTKHIIQCWLRQQHGEFSYAFDSVHTVSFELINSDNGKKIATTQVQLQWVYKNRKKKRRWRLF